MDECRKTALDLGIVLPLVRTRDNLDLPPHTYAVRVHGVEVGRGEAPSGAVLAIGDDLAVLPGVVTREPVFGLPAKWVPSELQQQAETAVADAEKAVHDFAGQVDAAAKSLFAPLAPPASPQG